MAKIDFLLKRLAHHSALSRPKPLANNFWPKIALAPRDPIISISQLYKEDPNPSKINLSIGTYRTDENKSFVFSSVRHAEKSAFQQSTKLEKEYSPMEGFEEFNRQAFRLLFGPNHCEKTSITVQTLAGTGAIDLGAAFLSKFYQGRKEVFISRPSWINYYFIFKNYQFDVTTFRYYDNVKKRFDSSGFFEDIAKLPDHSVVMFQPCGHNPASVQPNPDEWKIISRIVREKNILPYFDTAYHGLCSGDIDKDVYPIRQFAEDGHLMLVSQSFSKNMSLYGDRIGSLTILCDSEDEAYRVRSQLKNIIISKYICPPSQTGRTVASILQDATLKGEWMRELGDISRRLARTRSELRLRLEALCPSHSWQHITEHSGIFWYSGLTSVQVARLINEYSIYLCEDGRVNMAGINSGNIDRLTTVIRDVLCSG